MRVSTGCLVMGLALAAASVRESKADCTVLEGGWNTLNGTSCCGLGDVPQECPSEFKGCTATASSCRVLYHNTELDQDRYCDCICDPGVYLPGTPDHACCGNGIGENVCPEDDACIIMENYSKKCGGFSLSVSIFQPFSLCETTDSAGNCVPTVDWKAAAVGGFLAAKHFNARTGILANQTIDSLDGCPFKVSVDFLSDIRTHPTTIYISNSISRGFYDSDFVIGPYRGEFIEFAGAYSDNYGVPLGLSGRVPTDTVDIRLLNNSVQISPSESLVADATCKYLGSFGYSQVLSLANLDDEVTLSLLRGVKQSCYNNAVLVDTWLYSDTDFLDGNKKLREKLLTMNVTGINIILYFERDNMKVRQVLDEAFSIGLLRQQSMWMFYDDTIISTVFDAYDQPEIVKLLNGSHVIKPVGGDAANNIQYQRFLDSWRNLSVSEFEDFLKKSDFLSVPIEEDFFDTFNPRKSPHVRDVATFVYDALMAFSLSACKVLNHDSLLPTRETILNSMLKNPYGFNAPEFVGLTGNVRFNEKAGRTSESSLVGLLLLHADDEGGFISSLIGRYNSSSNLLVNDQGVVDIFNGGTHLHPPNKIGRQVSTLHVGLLHSLVTSEWASLLKLALLAVSDFNALENSDCNKEMSLFVYTQNPSVEVTVENVVKLVRDDDVDLLLGPIGFKNLLPTTILSNLYTRPQLSFESTPHLMAFSNLISSAVPTKTKALVMCKFLHRYRYQNVALLYPEGAYGVVFRDTMTSECPGIEFTSIEYTSESQDKVNNQRAISYLAQSRLNVVIYCAEYISDSSKATFEQLLQYSYEQDLLSSGKMWIFSDWYIRLFFESVQHSSIRDFLSGSLVFDFEPISTDTGRMDAFRERWASFNASAVNYQLHGLFQNVSGNQDFLDSSTFKHVGTYLYDTVITAGKLACEVTPKNKISHPSFAEAVLNRGLGGVQFKGLSGDVHFNEEKTRDEGDFHVVISNLIQVDGHFQERSVGAFNFESDSFAWRQELVFNAKSTTLPEEKSSRPVESFRVGVLQTISIWGASNETCNSPRRWINETCYEDINWGLALATALLAAEHFNQRDPTFVPELESLHACPKKITVSLYDSGGDGSTAVRAMDKIIEDGTDLMVGPFSDDESVATAMFGGVHGLPQISFGATSLELNNRELYPYFMRTIVTALSGANALCALWKSEGYRFVTIFYIDDHFGRSVQHAIRRTCGANKTFVSFPHEEDEQSGKTVHSFFENNPRPNVYCCVFQDDKDGISLNVLKQLIQHSSKDKQWFFFDKVLLHSLPEEEQAKLSGSFLIQSMGGVLENPSYQKFAQAWEDEHSVKEFMGMVSESSNGAYADISRLNTQSRDFLAKIAAYVYDAVIVAGIQTCKVSGNEPIIETHYASKFVRNIDTLRIKGLTGSISFDQNGNRRDNTANIQLFNFVDKQTRLVGKFEQGSFALNCASCAQVVYGGGRSVPLADVVMLKENLKSSPHVKAACMFLSVCTMLASVGAMVWTYFHRAHHFLVYSQVPLLYVIGFGGIVSSLTIAFLTIDDISLPLATDRAINTSANIACNAALWTYCIGFALMMMPLFEELDRISIIFGSAFTQKEAKRARGLTVGKLNKAPLHVPLHSLHYLRYTGKTLVIEVVILLMWMIFDPYKYIRVPDTFDEYGYIASSRGICTSKASGIGMIAISSLHLSILLTGCWLSYKLKKLRASEPEYINVALISNFQVVLLVGPILSWVRGNPKTEMFIQSAAVALNSLSILGVVFLPKMYYLRSGTLPEEYEHFLKIMGTVSPLGNSDKTIGCVRESQVAPAPIPRPNITRE
mmetsp:Transcript_23685/g.37812  ORF Transcript_23685/g.37812 Transcript_23685/m.37812 type:complete len:1810 (+) Transcript_23685:446-5875(+)